MAYSSRQAITSFMFSRLPKRARDFLSHRFLLCADFPEVVHIENTNACNTKCIMCPRDKLTREIGFMDFGLFKKIIDECSLMRRQLREVHLHGFGECLLEKDFPRKVSYAKDKGIRTVYIVTNGSLLSEEIAKGLVVSGLDKIKVSFYGATEETYEKVHLNLKFNEVEHNVLNLFRMRAQLNRKNPSIFLQFLPLSENSHEKILFSEKWGRVIEKDKGDSLLEYRLHNYGIGKNYYAFESEGRNKKSCVLPFTTMQLLWNGDIVSCCFDFNGDLILGDVNKQTVKEAWNSRPFINLRNAHRKINFSGVPLCMRCDQNTVYKNKT